MYFIGSRERFTSNSFLMHMLPAGAVLVTVLGLSILSWRNSNEALRNERDSLTSNFVGGVEKRISDRQNSHDLILKGAAGLYTASENVKREEWKAYIGTYDLVRNYPGVQGLGFARYARNSSDLAAIAASAQKDGVTNFKLSPVGTRSEYAINYYFEPKSVYPFGFDIMTDGQRSDVIQRAKSSGTTVLSGKRSFSIDGQPERVGYSVFIPVYSNTSDLGKPVDQRAIKGFAYMPILSQEFFDQIIGTTPNQKFSVRIYDQAETTDSLLYESKKFASITAGKNYYSQKSTVQMYGRTWILDFRFDPTVVSDTTRNRPLNSIIAGVLLSILLSGFVLTLLTARTRALSHSQEMEVQSAKDELLSLASHQLRTPATSVKQYVGMVLEGFAGKVPKQQRELLDKAYESNERQLHIINELLYVAKIDAKGIVISPRKLNLNKLTKEVIQDFLPAAKKNKQKILLDLPQRTIYAEADEHCLRMSLENLVNNALKYSHAGRPVTVKLSNRKNMVQISVKDRGIGIAEEDLPLLFKQFSRIPNEFSIKSSGSGIGLYLSQQLIGLHGGEITVDSQVGTGATFTIHLPKNQNFDQKTV
jgi:two-component system, OmpR family, sensor kinase